MVDPHQDFYMRIAMRISAYADHPHEPHGSATAWPTLVARHVQYAVFPLFSHCLHTCNTGPVEVVIVLSGLNELVVLNVSLHGLSRFNKVVVATIDLKLTARSRRMWNTGTETVRVFRDELVVNAVLQGAQDDHGAGVVDLDFLH